MLLCQQSYLFLNAAQKEESLKNLHVVYRTSQRLGKTVVHMFNSNAISMQLTCPIAEPSALATTYSPLQQQSIID